MDNKFEWNLSTLYLGFNDEKFINDIEKLKKNLKQLKNFSNSIKNTNIPLEQIINKIEEYLAIENELGDTYTKLLSYSNLVLSTNSDNIKALKYIDIIENLLSEISKIEPTIYKWLYSIKDNFEKIYNKSKIIEEHKYYINNIIENHKYTLSEKEEEIISKFKITGSNTWEKLWETITSNHTVKIDNKDIPLAEIRNMAYSSDKNIRKKAYECEIESYEKISQISAYCLNSIKAQVINECDIRGYASPLSMTIKNSRIDENILNIIINSIKENLCYFQKYFYKKAEILGYKDGLPFYELFAPINNVNIKFTYDEAMEIIIKNFHKFSNSLGEYAEKAYKNRWIDVYPKKGKRGGAFCDNIHSIKESRILTNFTGSFSDLITLAHELGHGYHGQCLDNETFINSDYPMPIAETASTFCETIIKNSILTELKYSDKDTTIMILENDLQDSSQIIVDILSRFIFEDQVFNKRKISPLSSEEFCDIMIEAQNKTYGKGLNKNYQHKYMWICKPHYYDANYNYYNFPYAFGLLLSKGLYAIYENSKNTFPEIYTEFLRKTGRGDIETVAKSVGIDITKKDFWLSSLDIIKRDIEKFINI